MLLLCIVISILIFITRPTATVDNIPVTLYLDMVKDTLSDTAVVESRRVATSNNMIDVPAALPLRRKVVLLGPHDRYNFGDLLFEKVVSQLLVDVTGLSSDDLLSGDIHSVDMSTCPDIDANLNPNIHSMKEVQEISVCSPGRAV
jgi:hypothetical protein